MTPEEQRIAIANVHLGWKPEVRKMWAGEKNVRGWGRNQHLHPGDKDRHFTTYVRDMPDYLNDLNATHEMEKTLTFEQYHHEFIPQLELVCTRQKQCMYSSAASLRCEAFLRAKNLWKD